MTISEAEIAAVLAALRVLDPDKQPPVPDRWILAARLEQEPDPWLPPGGETYPKLHSSLSKNRT